MFPLRRLVVGNSKGYVVLMDGHTSFLRGQYQARMRWNTQVSGAAFDRKKRSFLSPEAQEFLAQQVMCVLVGMDEHGALAGRLVFGSPGFAASPEPATCILELDRETLDAGFLSALGQHAPGSQLALFFISYATRERLCVHGTAEIVRESWPARLLSRAPSPQKLLLNVQQAFFHCPRYIRTTIAGLTAPALVKGDRARLLRELPDGTQHALSPFLRDFLWHQVSCFLCTVNHQGICAVNHRGGAPGFLTALPPDQAGPGGWLLMPDYKGNGAFEAVGNILETGLATVIVPDYSMQVALSVCGQARILELGDLTGDLQEKCVGAERVICLTVQELRLQSGDWTLPLLHTQEAAATRQRSMACNCSPSAKQDAVRSV